MAKIDTIGGWSAHAALHSAIEASTPEDGVVVILLTDNGTQRSFRTANMNNATIVYLMEGMKLEVMSE